MVGLSDRPERPSYQVAQYLLSQGFEIIPVNPMVDEVLGRKSYASISDVLRVMDVDMVDIFRKPAAVPAIVTAVIESGQRPMIWMQEGVVCEEGKRLAEQAGMKVVMNACMMKTHKAGELERVLQQL